MASRVRLAHVDRRQIALSTQSRLRYRGFLGFPAHVASRTGIVKSNVCKKADPSTIPNE